jgi:hypothetical protein
MTRDFRGTFRTAGFVVAVAVLLLGSIGAGGAEGFTSEQRAACTPDVFRLCAGDMPNVPAITACMRKNRSNLSPACKAVFPR